MNGIPSICFLLVATTWLPLRASDGEAVVVKSSSVENRLVSLHAELAGKKTAFTCVVDSPSCASVQPGEYIMVRAEAEEGIYNDCTNVVLYKSSSDAKKKLGVYCWLNDDCYMFNCTPVKAQTIPASDSDEAISPKTVSSDQPAKTDGKLVVLVTWGDVDNTPATNVYVEAYGFVVKHGSKKSFVLKMSQAGRYEGSLPPGVYDVFVSEGTSNPRCRRVLITADHSGNWTLKLEHDDVYLQR
jgi:hypothetical protein